MQFDERYSRQILLAGVGKEGQKKLSLSKVLLCAEGILLESALTALATTGVTGVYLYPAHTLDPRLLSLPLDSLEVIPLPPRGVDLPSVSAALVLTQDVDFRRELNRRFRVVQQPTVFGWLTGSGVAIFSTDFKGDPSLKCPCFECFEALNPKAFGRGNAAVQSQLGALAASETLQWVLFGSTPLLHKVWLVSQTEGMNLHHEVFPSPKCPARLLEEGAMVTP